MADDDGKKKDEEMEKRFGAIEASLKGVTDSLGKLAEGMTGISETVKTLGTRDDDDDKKKKGKKKSPDNLELMSRMEFTQVLMDMFTDVVDEKLKPLSESISGVSQNVENKGAKALYDRLKRDYKDFDDWKDEIVTKMKASPGMNPDDAYKLVRLENPKKTKEMDEKYKSEEQKQKEEAEKKAAENKGKMGGLTPTSSKTVQSEKMGGDDAAELAWEKVMGAGTDAT